MPRLPLAALLALVAACATIRHAHQDARAPLAPDPPPECPMEASADRRTRAPAAYDEGVLVESGRAAATIRGRVVDVRGEPLPEQGVAVRLDVGDRRAQVMSDADGRFAFPLAERPEHASIRVEAEPPLRRLHVPYFYPRRLETRQLAGEQIRLRVARTVSGVLRGVAVDAESGEPLPGLRFTVSPAGRRGPNRFASFAVETDANGRFRSQGEIRGGPANICTPHDEPSSDGHLVDLLISTSAHDEPTVLRFRAGPTYTLELRGAVPRDLSSLGAWLVPEDGVRRGRPAPIRVDEASGRAWVRFQATGIDAGTPCFLAVGDTAGLVTGATPVRLRPKTSHEPVVVVLERTAALKIDLDLELPSELTDSQEEALLRGGVRRELERVDAEATDGTTAWRLGQRRSLRPGTYRVRAWSRLHALTERTVTLHPGDSMELPLQMELLPDLRRVRGVVRTANGAPLPDLDLYLVHHDGEVTRRCHVEHIATPSCVVYSIVRTETGPDESASRAAFEIDYMPAGRLECVVRDWNGSAASVRRKDLSDGTLELRIELGDPAAGPGQGFRAHPGLDEDELLFVDARRRADGLELPTRTTRGGVLERRDPSRAGLAWSVWRPGFRPVHVLADDFADEGGGRRIADLSFERGWGTRLVVRDAAGTPVGGARVLADDVLLGATDALGRFDVALGDPPAALRVEHGGAVARAPRQRLGGSTFSPWIELTVGPLGGR